MKPHVLIMFFESGFFYMKESIMRLKEQEVELSLLELKFPIADIVEQIEELNPDGILLQSWHKQIKPILTFDIPTAVVNATMEWPGCISVGVDDFLIGQRVADYFISKQFKKFAYLGVDDCFSYKREKGFCDRLKKHGFDDYCTHSLSDYKYYFSHFDNQYRELEDWLIELPKPIALMAYSDPIGQTVSVLAHRHNIAIPGDIAMVGVMNDCIACDLATPSLSSVPFPWTKMCDLGWAELLKWLRGNKPSRTYFEIEPEPIHVRQSSSVFSVEDTLTRLALNWLRERAHEAITINQLCKSLSLNRRALEKAFKKYLDSSPREELERIRIDNAKYYLINSNFDMSIIAQTCGFNNPRRLLIAFKRVEGISPSEYRKEVSKK